MDSFQQFLEHKNQLVEHKDLTVPLPPEPPDSAKDSGGGYQPKGKKQIEIYKKVDLITLPPTVTGTNCGNCEFHEQIKNNLMFCRHKDIQQYVTKFQCCAEWNRDEVKRVWDKDKK